MIGNNYFTPCIQQKSLCIYIQIYIIVLSTIGLSCSKVKQGDNVIDYNFYDYYKNEFHANNEIWKADSLLYTGEVISAILEYRDLLTIPLSTSEIEYIQNQHNLAIWKNKLSLEFVDEIKVNQYNDSAILTYQRIVLNRIFHQKGNINIYAFISSEYFDLNKPTHFKSQLLIEQLYQSFYYRNSIEDYRYYIEKINQYFESVGGSSSDYIEYLFLQYNINLSNGHLENNNKILSTLDSTIPNNSEYTNVLIYLYKGEKELISNNLAIAIQYNDEAYNIISNEYSQNLKQYISYRLTLIALVTNNDHSYFLERYYNDSNIDYYSINKLYSYINYYEKELNQSTIELINTAIKEVDKSIYLEREEAEILHSFASTIEENRNKYRISRDYIFKAINYINYLDDREYSNGIILDTVYFNKEDYYYTYLHVYSSLMYKELHENYDPKLVNTISTINKTIDSLSFINIDSDFEEDILRMNSRKKKAYNYLLESSYYLYKKTNSQEYIEDFHRFSAHSRNTILLTNKIDPYSRNRHYTHNSIKPDYVGSTNDFRVSISKTKSLLKNTTLIIFDSTPKNTFIQVIRDTSYSIFKSKNINTNIDTLTKIIRNRENFSSYAKSSKIVYDELISPWYKEDKNIIVIPDDKINQLPIEALADVNNVQNYCNVDYLAKKSSIMYAHSVATIDTSEIYFPQDKTIGAFGFSHKKDFLTNKNNSLELAGSFLEVDWLDKNWNCSCHFSNNANRETFLNIYKNQKYNIIHLAMHGLSDSDNRFNNYILFKSHHKNQYDTLFAYDLIKHSEPKQLISLSACNTASGKYYEGEGQYSLSRFFLMNNTKRIISSRWELDDIYAYNFYKQFYKNYELSLRNNFSICQKSAINNNNNNIYCHPFFWSNLKLFIGYSLSVSIKPTLVSIVKSSFSCCI